MGSLEIRNILLKQAEHIQNKSEKMDTAKQLRLAADLLEADANKSLPGNFLKMAREEKKTRMDKFNSNVEAGLKKELAFSMNRFGFYPYVGKDKPGENCFILKERPEYKITVKNGKFNLYKHGEMILHDIYLKDDKFQFINPAKFIKADKK
jgi:hypothetical protein